MKDDHSISNEVTDAAPREWAEPRVEKLDVDATRGGANPADEDLIPVTAPPS